MTQDSKVKNKEKKKKTKNDQILNHAIKSNNVSDKKNLIRKVFIGSCDCSLQLPLVLGPLIDKNALSRRIGFPYSFLINC